MTIFFTAVDVALTKCHANKERICRRSEKFSRNKLSYDDTARAAFLEDYTAMAVPVWVANVHDHCGGVPAGTGSRMEKHFPRTTKEHRAP